MNNNINNKNNNLVYLDDYLDSLNSDRNFKLLIKMKQKLAKLKYDQTIIELGIETAEQKIKKQSEPNIFKT